MLDYYITLHNVCEIDSKHLLISILQPLRRLPSYTGYALIN